MPDSRRALTATPSHNGVRRHGVGGLTAAAQLLSDLDATTVNVKRVGPAQAWQDEAWDYYESLGEFNYGVEWFGEALSRVRLVAAEVAPGGDEPEILRTGPAADLVEGLAGGTSAQSQLLRSLGVHISVPGEAYLVGREVTDAELASGDALDALPDDDGRVWTIQPTGTMRAGGRLAQVRSALTRRRPARGTLSNWEMMVDDGRWVPVHGEALVTRIWDRDERRPWRAASPARSALPIMREIDMYNRHIMASLVSRVALNGLLLIPEEITLPTSPQYEDADDPFMAELIDVMRTAIRNPGSPASAAPLPLQVPAEMIERFRHLTFATPLDEKVWTARQGAVQRLAASLNLPQEILTGMGGATHWSAWQLDESAIKIHIVPKVEVITRCLTLGYLHPMLRAAGQEIRTKTGNRIIVWFHTSELTQRPDRSEMAVQLNERVIISDAATRRETGFDEADAPSADEQKSMLLRQLVRLGSQLAGPALHELTGIDISPPQTPATGATGSPSGPGGPEGTALAAPRSSAPVAGNSPTNRDLPETRGAPPPSTDEAAVTASGRRAQLRRRVNGGDDVRAGVVVVGESPRGG